MGWGWRGGGGVWEAWGLGGSPGKVSGAKGWWGTGLGGDSDDQYQAKQRKKTQASPGFGMMGKASFSGKLESETTPGWI